MYLKRISTSENISLIGGSVPYLKINKFNKYAEITAVFSTRLGGVSTGQFTSMNFCTTLGDTKENVLANFEIFGRECKLKNFVLSKQTHTTNVLTVTKEDINKGLTKPMDYDNIDGLITNIPNITLSTFYADCVPLYFYDPIHRVIGLSHAGWRGTVDNIAKATIDKMQAEFNSKPEDIVCAIGPSICVNCYEVSKDVADEFIKAFNIKTIGFYEAAENKALLPADTKNILYKKSESDKYMLNLWAANYQNMLNSKIKSENISLPDVCTCENKEILFSHRGLKGKRGNLGAFMMINQD